MTILLFIVLIILMLNNDIASHSVIESLDLWFYRLVPVLLPVMLLTDIIVNSKILAYLSNKAFKIIHKLFNIRYEKSVILIMISILCGAPASTKLIIESFNKNEIDLKEATSLIYSLSCFSLPYIIYILNRININFLYYFIPNILTTIIIFNKLNKGEISLIKQNKLESGLLNSFFTSINKTINVLFVILVIIISFNTLISILNISDYFYFILEPLKGIELLINLKNIRLRKILILLSLNILGLSPIMQIKYVFEKINIAKLILIKLLVAIPYLCFLIITIILS